MATSWHGGAAVCLRLAMSRGSGELQTAHQRRCGTRSTHQVVIDKIDNKQASIKISMHQSAVRLSCASQLVSLKELTMKQVHVHAG
jgi:hypothetical protein